MKVRVGSRESRLAVIQSELLMEAVDRIIPTDGEIMLESIFGQRKILKAKIKEMALLDHKIILEKL